MTARQTGLGRGLGALIPSQGPDARLVDIDLVTPNPHQPRGVMRPEEIQELAESIREHGVLQPLLVTEVRSEAGNLIYQLIAGERRLQASRLAGLERVPVIVREAAAQQQLEYALVENIQRSDLNPLEEAAAYQRLVGDFGLTQDEVARRVGKSRTAVANSLRLLGLDEELKASLARGEMTEGHARALLGIRDPGERRTAWQAIIDRGLTVRQVESIAKRAKPRRPGRAEGPVTARRDPEEARTLDLLRKALGTKVEIQRSGSSGTVSIHFFSDEEYESVVNYLLGT